MVKVPTSNRLLLEGIGGWRQAYCEPEEVVIRKRKGGVGEDARSAGNGVQGCCHQSKWKCVSIVLGQRCG